jgi:hypothetical protein
MKTHATIPRGHLRHLSAQARRVFRAAIGVTLALAVSGCETAREYSLTYKVWDQAQRPSSRPAPDARLELFASPTGGEILVVYDVLSERREDVERRAYFAVTNESRIMAGKPPQYLAASLATNMISVPVFAKTNSIANQPIAARFPVLLDRGPGFELFRDGRSQGAYQLPVYDEGISRSAQVALTPLAVTGDTLLATGVVATAGAFLWVMAGCPPFANSR